MTRDEEIQYKRLYAHALRPFMDLIKYHREEGTTGSWIEMAEKIFARAITNPEQYLGKDLPPPDVIKKIVTEIFNDFVKANTPIFVSAIEATGDLKFR